MYNLPELTAKSYQACDGGGVGLGEWKIEKWVSNRRNVQASTTEEGQVSWHAEDSRSQAVAYRKKV